MARLLIVDDEPRIRDVVRQYAELNNHDIEEASGGKEALDLMKQQQFDLIIMDIMMPNIDGFTAIEEIRKAYSTPIIMLSARSEESDKLLGFKLGADDYLTKPFSPRELMARVQAVLQRTEQRQVEHAVIFHDKEGRRVLLNGEPISLTPREYELLAYLMDHPHIALSRDQLFESIWGYDSNSDDRTVDTHIKMLRNHLEDYRDCIVTVRGYGYKYEPRQKDNANKLK